MRGQLDPAPGRALPPEPYVIQAVSGQGALVGALDGDANVQGYRDDAADPISVGWDLTLEDAVNAPGYDGLTDLSYATPLAGKTSEGTDPARGLGYRRAGADPPSLLPGPPTGSRDGWGVSDGAT